MKKMIAGVLSLALIVIAIFGYVTISLKDVTGYVSIDINPSVQFITNASNEVVSVSASNNDGQIILANEAQSLIGMNIEDASARIVELAIEYGYLDPEALETDPNAVTITTMLENAPKRLQNRFKERIRVKLENYFKNNGIFGIVLTDLDMEQIVLEATELGIGAGKLKLIRSVQYAYPELTLQEALTKTTKELMDMLRDVRRPNEFISYLENQITLSQTNINGLLATKLAKETNLSGLNEALATLNEVDTSAFTEEELVGHLTQIETIVASITNLETELMTLDAQLLTAQTLLLHLQETLTDRQNYLNDLETELNIKKQQAMERYENWLEHKEERAEQVKNRWKEFKNSINESQYNDLLQGFQNAWQNRR